MPTEPRDDQPTNDAPKRLGPGEDVASSLGPHGRPGYHRPPRKEDGRAQRVPRHVVALRTAMIARAMVRGLGRSAILETVAKAQQEEHKKRAGAVKTGATEDEARDLVPPLWGDVPVPERTVDEYIRRAKVALAEEGAKVVQNKEFVFSMQLARYNEVYRAAFADRKYHAALKALERVDKLFGLEEAIKVMFLNLNADDVKGSQPGHDLTSEAGRAAALASIMAKAGQESESFRGVLARFARVTGTALALPDATNGAGPHA